MGATRNYPEPEQSFIALVNGGSLGGSLPTRVELQGEEKGGRCGLAESVSDEVRPDPHVVIAIFDLFLRQTVINPLLYLRYQTLPFPLFKVFRLFHQRFI